MANIRKNHDRAWLVSWWVGRKKRYRQFRTEAMDVHGRYVLTDIPRAL